MKSVFVSYKYDDKKSKDRLLKWVKDKCLGDVVVTGETKDVRNDGKKAIKNHLSPKLKGASIVLVLVGENTHNSTGVEYEIQHAKSHKKKIVSVRIPKTRGAAPKSIRDVELIAFTQNDIKEAIN